MAEGLIPRVENLQLEDVEILTEDQIKQELGIPQSSLTVLDHLRRNFMECGINIDSQFSPAESASLWNVSIQQLRIRTFILRTTLNDLVLYSHHFRQYQLNSTFGSQLGYPYDMSVEDFMERFMHSAQLDNNGILRMQSKRKSEIVIALSDMTNLIVTMRVSGIPFHLWPIPRQLM